MELIERARGMFVGIGVGNLLGLPYEGWSADRIRSVCPDGVQEIAAEAGWPDDDDLAQALLLADACIEREALDFDDLLPRFWEWGELNGLGMGGLTGEVLSLYGGSSPRRLQTHAAYFGGRDEPSTDLAPLQPRGVLARDAARLAWEDGGRSSAGNGSVMRCGAVALRWLDDDAALARNSAASAAATHWDPRCVWSTLLTDFTIAACLRGETIEGGALLERAGAALRASRDELSALNIHLPEQPHPHVEEALDTALAPDARVEDLLLDSGGIGYAPKTLGAVLWAAGRAESVEQGLSAIVSAGGDADTNGAPSGAVLGARFGLEGIPARWRSRVSDIRAHPVSPNWPAREPLESYADRLFQVRQFGR